MSLFQRPLCTRMLFHFLKSTMPLSSVYCDIFHLPLILNIHWRRYIMRNERERKKDKWENHFHRSATDVRCLSKHWAMYSIEFRRKILSGLGAWGRRGLNILIRFQCSWNIQIAISRCFRKSFFCCQAINLKQRCSKPNCFILAS